VERKGKTKKPHIKRDLPQQSQGHTQRGDCKIRLTHRAGAVTLPRERAGGIASPDGANELPQEGSGSWRWTGGGELLVKIKTTLEAVLSRLVKRGGGVEREVGKLHLEKKGEGKDTLVRRLPKTMFPRM